MLKGLIKMALMVGGELDLLGFGRGGGAGGFLLAPVGRTAGLPGSGQVDSMESFSASPAGLQVR